MKTYLGLYYKELYNIIIGKMKLAIITCGVITSYDKEGSLL